MQFSFVSPSTLTKVVGLDGGEHRALCPHIFTSHRSALPCSWGYIAGFQGFLLVPMDMSMDCGVLSSKRAIVPILSFPTV